MNDNFSEVIVPPGLKVRLWENEGPLGHAPLFQPHTSYRTLDFDRALPTRMMQKIVKRWADYSRVGDLSLHDLRRTDITIAMCS